MRRMLAARTIAVVGASDDEMRPGHYVPEYLIAQGYEVIPVNPKYGQVFGVTCYKTLAEIPGEVDIVNVFRRPNACGEVARQAIAKGVKGIWLQSGIFNDEARKLAREAGIDFVQDRCIMVEHRRRGR
jgi:hypothetical protein